MSDPTPVERWEVTTPPDVFLTQDDIDQMFDDELWRN